MKDLKTAKKIGALSLFLFLTLFCKDEETVEVKGLKSSSSTHWKSNCIPTDYESAETLYLLSTLKIEDDSLSIKATYFSDNICTKKLKSQTETWTVSNSSESGNLKKITLSPINKKEVVHEETLLSLYNNLNPNDKRSLGIEKDISKEKDFCSNFYGMMERKEGSLKFYQIKANQKQAYSQVTNPYIYFYQ